MKRITYIILLLTFLSNLLLGCTFNGVTTKNPIDKDAMPTSKQKFIEERIIKFTKSEFRFTRETKVKFVNVDAQLDIFFIPEVGSYPIKNDILRQVASHAVAIKRFFPEVVQYRYVIMWGDKNPQEAMVLTIDKKAAEALLANYYGAEIAKNGGIKPNYRSVFSNITETKISQGWR